MKYIRVTMFYGETCMGSYISKCEDTADALSTFADECGSQERLVFEPVEMDESEYNSLPEFTGF